MPKKKTMKISFTEEMKGEVLPEEINVIDVVVSGIELFGRTEVPEIELHSVVIAGEVNVGPHQPGNHAEDEGYGVFLQETDELAGPCHWTTSKRGAGEVTPMSFRAANRRRLYHRIRRGPNPLGPKAGQSRLNL